MVSTPLKNMKINGKDDIPYMKWKIKFMFQTTNQFGVTIKIRQYNILCIYIYKIIYIYIHKIMHLYINIYIYMLIWKINMFQTTNLGWSQWDDLQNCSGLPRSAWFSADSLVSKTRRPDRVRPKNWRLTRKTWKHLRINRWACHEMSNF